MTTTELTLDWDSNLALFLEIFKYLTKPTLCDTSHNQQRIERMKMFRIKMIRFLSKNNNFYRKFGIKFLKITAAYELNFFY